MGGSYRQCIQCGKRALSIATRCPGCGAEFPDRPVPETGGAPELRGFLTPRGVAALLASVAVLASATLGRSSHPPEEQSASVAADSVAVATAALDTARAVVVSPAEGGSELLVARTWTNVRKSRSRRAGLEAVLTPGDTVVADSLRQGWYRVALEGEVLGYAHRSTLTAPGLTGRAAR